MNNAESGTKKKNTGDHGYLKMQIYLKIVNGLNSTARLAVAV
jgi:hypothetical protein